MTTSATTASPGAPITKAISLESRLAEAVAMWGQWIITSPRPPAGNLAPPGATSAPGAPIDRGERIAIYSGDGDGHILATAVVFDVAYISNAGEPGPPGQSNWATAIEIKADCTLLHGFDIQPIAANSSWWNVDITDQLPLGNVTPGRWAWLLSDVEMLERPIPCGGGGGVWPLPDDISEQLAHPREVA